MLNSNPPTPHSPLCIPHSIGTKHESSLHRDLKFAYTGEGGQTEAEFAGFVADGISSQGEFIEVQTGSFGPLRKKVLQFAEKGRVRIVYPIAMAKYIEVYNAEGKRQYRRKSPRKGSPWDIFNALVYAPELPLVSGLTIELALLDMVETRYQDGKGSWRRKGVSIGDRRIAVSHERICLAAPSDYLRFVPFEGDDEFTSSALGEKAGIPADLARKALYVLTRIGVVHRIARKRNSYIYKVVLIGKNRTRKKKR